MIHRRLGLAAWLLFCVAHAVDYAGTQCAGIIDFQLDAPAVPEVENQIAFGLAALYGTTPWIETSCLVSLRTRACMLGYNATGIISDGHGYCRSSCEEQLAICAGFNGLIGMDPLSQFGLSCDMAVDDPDCHTGGVSQVAEQSPVCPRPLVRPDSASRERDAHVEMIDGTACAMPCPNTLSFNEDDWDAFNIVTLTTTSFALVCSIIAAVTHYLSKNWNIFYLTAGLTISAFTMMLYFAIDYDYSVSCSGNAGHVEHDPFCMFVAVVLIYFCLWFSEWTLLLAANLFLGVVMGWKKPQLEKFRNKALYYIVFMPCLSWAIPMAAGNLGNEWTGANVKTCIYMTTTSTEAYFWSFAWGPLFAYMVIATVLCAFTIYTVTKHTSTMATYEEGEQGSKATRKLRKFWRYNKRQIAFLVIFVCTTVVTLAGWMDAHVSSGTRKSEIEDFVECLLTSATTDPDHARSVCNQPESVDYWKTQLVLCYVGAFGAFPLFVFGTGGFFKRTSEAPTSKDNESSTVESSTIRRVTMRLFKAMSASSLKPQPSDNAAASIEVSSAVEKDKQSTVF